MRNAEERRQINAFLGRASLAQLDEPAALIKQLAFMVRDHRHFAQLLSKCEPEQRVAMYESMRPHVRFEARPLDVYMSEAARDAEVRQLPTVGPDGSLHAFQVQEVGPKTDTEIAQKAIADALAKNTLVLSCVKCTRVEEFKGERKADAIYAARMAGWTYDELDGTGREICPDCPAGTRLRMN